MKGQKIRQKEIFRLAASIFAITDNQYSVYETYFQMISCVFYGNGNEYLNKYEILNEINRLYGCHISEEEFSIILKNYAGSLVKTQINEEERFKLVNHVHEAIVNVQTERTIDSFIDDYINEFNIDKEEWCKDAIHKYLYELTTTNINSYNILLTGIGEEQYSENELYVTLDDMSTEEIDIVRNFLSWENPEKNEALGKIVYCCLEYCLAINGDNTGSYIKKIISNQVVYLDTNVLFRALGINGNSRQKVMISFLDKCKQAKIKLIVSHFTKKEFETTVDQYIRSIGTYPRGNIYPGAIESISDYTLFTYYDEWLRTHKSLSLDYFKKYITSKYNELIKKYKIYDDEMIPREIFQNKDYQAICSEYSSDIQRWKQNSHNQIAELNIYTASSIHDGNIIHYLEYVRDKKEDGKVFFASTDKALRVWDMNRPNQSNPIVIYPSQLFLLLIIATGRSDNDFESFVNFINIHSNMTRVSPAIANVIISGISSITEDIEKQKGIVSTVFDEEFQSIIKNSGSDSELYDKVQEYSKNYLAEELKLVKNESEQRLLLVQEKDEQLLSQKEQSGKTIEHLQGEINQKDNQLYEIARKNINPQLILKFYILPFICLLIDGLFIFFIYCQVFPIKEEYNVAKLFFDALSQTLIGKQTDSLMWVVDGVIFSVVFALNKKYLKNPANKTERDKYIEEKIKNMLSKE